MSDLDKTIKSLRKTMEDGRKVSSLKGSDGYQWLLKYLVDEVTRCTNELLDPNATREQDLTNKARIKAYTDLQVKMTRTAEGGEKAAKQLEDLEADNA